MGKYVQLALVQHTNIERKQLEDERKLVQDIPRDNENTNQTNLNSRLCDERSSPAYESARRGSGTIVVVRSQSYKRRLLIGYVDVCFRSDSPLPLVYSADFLTEPAKPV